MAIHSKTSRATAVGSIYTWVILCAAGALVAGVAYWLFNTGTLMDRAPTPIRVLVGAICLPGIMAGVLTVGNFHADFGGPAIVLMSLVSGLFWSTSLFLARLVFQSLGRRFLPHLRP
jgi:hypothetical protein